MAENVEVLNDSDVESVEIVSETGLVKPLEIVSQSHFEKIKWLADNIDELVTCYNKIRAGALKLAQPGDWIKFGDKGELGFAGANRIGKSFGVGYKNFVMTRESGTDALGDWYRWECECDVYFGENNNVRTYGRSSSRDKLFGVAHKKYKPLHDVDEGNIKMAARHGAMKEGVKIHFGLHHMDIKILEEAGIKVIATKGPIFKSDEDIMEETTGELVTPSEVNLYKEGKQKDGELYKVYKISTVEKKDFFTYSDDVRMATLKIITKKAKALVSSRPTKYGNNEVVALSEEVKS